MNRPFVFGQLTRNGVRMAAAASAATIAMRSLLG
jgi:hypothetical protein